MQQSDFISFDSGKQHAAATAATTSSNTATTQQQQFRSLNCEVLRTKLTTTHIAKVGGGGESVTGSPTGPIEQPQQQKQQEVERPDEFIQAIFNLTQPITVRAPCAVIGLTGHCLVQGFHLRQRALLIDGSASQHVAVQPLPKDSGNSNNNKTLEAAISSWGPCSGAVATLSHLATGTPLPRPAVLSCCQDASLCAFDSSNNNSQALIAHDLAALAEIEARFGSKLDWGWIRRTMADMSQRVGAASGHNAQHNLNDHVLVLVVARSSGSNNSGTGAESPPSPAFHLPFFAPRMAPVPHNILQDSLLPALSYSSPVASSTTSAINIGRIVINSKNRRKDIGRTAAAARAVPSLLVAGAVNTGKSTSCRFFCNTLLSLYGSCLWVDLDLGQSEFSPPGGIGLFRITRPLFCANQTDGVERLAFHFLGAPTMRDPVAMALALESLCEITIREASATSTAATGASNGSRRRNRDRTDDDDEDKNSRKAAVTAAVIPVVINTHGWVLSTGRRATLEVLQRLRPTQVVHLVAPAGGDDSRWLLPTAPDEGSSSSSPSASSRGLSGAVVATMFQAPTLPMMPCSSMSSLSSSSSSSRAAWSYTLHRVNLEKLFDKNAADIRNWQWTRYFSSGANTTSNKSGAVAMMLGRRHSLLSTSSSSSLRQSDSDASVSETRVPLSMLRLVFAEEDVMPWNLRGRRSRLLLLAPNRNKNSDNSSDPRNNNNNNNNSDRSLLSQLRETLHCGLVAVCLPNSKQRQPQQEQQQQQQDSGNIFFASAARRQLQVTAPSPQPPPSSLLVEQLSSIPSAETPNAAGFCVAICPEQQQQQQQQQSGGNDSLSTVTLVGPLEMIAAVENIVNSNSSHEDSRLMSASDVEGNRVTLLLGWQQFDEKWSRAMMNRIAKRI